MFRAPEQNPAFQAYVFDWTVVNDWDRQLFPSIDAPTSMPVDQELRNRNFGCSSEVPDLCDNLGQTEANATANVIGVERRGPRSKAAYARQPLVWLRRLIDKASLSSIVVPDLRIGAMWPAKSVGPTTVKLRKRQPWFDGTASRTTIAALIKISMRVGLARRKQSSCHR